MTFCTFVVSSFYSSFFFTFIMACLFSSKTHGRIASVNDIVQWSESKLQFISLKKKRRQTFFFYSFNHIERIESWAPRHKFGSISLAFCFAIVFHFIECSMCLNCRPSKYSNNVNDVWFIELKETFACIESMCAEECARKN